MAENLNNIPTVESSGDLGYTPPATANVGVGEDVRFNIPNTSVNPANFAPDYKTALDQLDFSPLTEMSYGPSPVNPETARLIEMAAIPINRIASPAYNDMNSYTPGRMSGNYNPNQDLGNLDLKTKEGRNQRLAQAFGNAANNTDPNKTPGYQDPFVFGSKKFNYDRMREHPQFERLGYHPLYNNEDYYNKNSTWYDDSRRMSKQWRRMFGNAFMSSYRNIGDMLNGNWEWSDDEGAAIMEDAMRIGSSTRGGFTGWLHNTTLSSAYTVGIMTNIGVEMGLLALATAASGGTALPATLTKAAHTVTAGAKGIYNSVRSISGISKMLQAMKIPDSARKAWNAFNATKVAQGMGTAGKYTAKFLTPSTLKAFKDLRTSAAGLDDLSQLAKTKKLFGAFYNDMRYINLAVAESRLEAGLVENETFQKLYDEFVHANGRPPSKEELALMRQQSIRAAKTTFLFNAPLIYLTNKVTIEKWMGSVKSLAGAVNLKGQAALFLKSPGKFGKNVYKGFKNHREMLMTGLASSEGRKHIGKYLGGAALRYGADGINEGMQEVYQETVSAAATHYYAGLYQQPIAAGYDIMEVAMTKDSRDKAMKAVRHGLDHGPSWGVFASGFFTGMLVAPYSKVMFQAIPNLFSMVTDNETYQKNKKAREDYIKQTEEWLNEMAADPAFYFNPKKLNVLAQKEFSREMFMAGYHGDVLNWRNSKEHSLFSHIYTALELGKLDEFRSYISDMLKLDDQALEEAFADDNGNVREGYKAEDLRKHFDGINEKLDVIQDNYDRFDEEFPNPFNRNKHEEGTREYYEEMIREFAWRHAKMQMIFNSDAMTNAAERKSSIENAIAEITGVSNLIMDDIMVLTSGRDIIAELNNLSRDIEALKWSKTPEDKKELAKLKKKKELLENFYEVLKDPENQHKSTKEVRNAKRVEKQGTPYKKRHLNIKDKLKKMIQEKDQPDSISDPKFGPKDDTKTSLTTYELKDKDITYTYELYDDGSISYTARVQNKTLDKQFASEKQLESYIKKQETTTYKTVIDSKTGKPVKQKTEKASIASLMLKYKRDAKSMKKLMKVFTPYVEFLVQEAGGKAISPEKMKDVLSMIVDYGHLNFRISDMYKANQVLSDPKKLLEYSKRISIPMTKLWKRYKRSQGRRVRKFVDNEIRKQYLKTLAKAGIFADPKQVEHFLKVENLTEQDIPTTFYAEDGEMLYDFEFGHTNQKQYEIMIQAKQVLMDELVKPSDPDIDEEGPDTSTIDEGSTAEDALNEDLTDDPKEKEEIIEKKSELNEFKNESKDTLDILDREYRKYREAAIALGMPVLARSEWLNQKNGGRAIIQARYQVYAVYEEDDDKDKYENFDAWLRDNIRSPRVQNIIEKNNLEPYAIMTEDVSFSKNMKEGTLLQGEKQAPGFENKYKDYDIFIIQVPGAIVGNKQTYVYQLRNSRGKNIFDEGTYSNLNIPREIFDSGYNTLAEANNAVKEILKRIPENTYFTFEGQKFKKGDRVTYKGKNYVVLSDVVDFTSKGKLVVRDELFPEAKPISIAPGEFQGWEKEETSNKYFKEIQITGQNIQRLSHGKGMTFGKPMPHELNRNPVLKNEKDLQEYLKNLTPERRAKLQIQISRAKQPNKKHGEEVNMNFGEINPLLRKGSKRFNVLLLDPDSGEVIGRLDGLSNFIFIDRKTGKTITPLEMTLDNVFDYFRNHKSKTAKQQLKEIQENYAQLTLIEELFDEVLNKVNTEKITIRLDSLQNGKLNKSTSLPSNEDNKNLIENLKDVFVYVTPGSKVFTERGKKDHETPLAELKYKYINQNGDMFILDTSALGADISNLEYKNQLAIRAAIDRQGLGGLTGRYILAVRTPNNMYEGGYFHLVELRTTSLSEADTKTLFNKIMSQQRLTISENITNRGKVKQDKKKGLGYKYNEGFNTELQNTMYVAMPHGHNFNITLQPSGDITFKFAQSQDAGGQTFTITLNRKDIEDAKLESMQDMLDLASNKLREEFQKELNNNPQFIVPLGFGVELQSSKLGGVPRNLQVSQIRNTIKADPSIKELHADGVVAIAPKDVTGNVYAQLRYSNTEEINNLIASQNNKTQIERDAAAPSKIKNDLFTFERYEKAGWHHYPKEALEALAIKMLTDEENLTDTEKQIIAVTRLEEKIKNKEIEVNVETETEGGIGLTGNETQEELMLKKKRIEDKIKQAEIQAEEKIEKEIEGSNPNLSSEERNDLFDKAMDEWEKNPGEEYISLQKQKKEIDSKLTAGKIIRHDNYDGNDVVDLDEFIAWAKENLPSFITIEDIEKLGMNLATNGITVGTFAMTLKNIAGKINIDGKIYTGANQPFKYHEAFHAVFRMLLTEAEQKVLYDKAEIEVNKKLNSKNGYRYQGKTYKSLNPLLKDFRKESPIYKNLSRSDLRKRLYEEYMADEFDKFKMNPRLSKTDSTIKNFFTRLIEMIRSIFRKFSGNDLRSFYEKIDSGKFKNTTIQENSFTRPSNEVNPAQEVTQYATKIVIGTQLIQKSVLNRETNKNELSFVEENIYMSSDEEVQMRNNIAALFLKRMRQPENSELNKAALLQKTVRDYINIFNPSLARHKKSANYRDLRRTLKTKLDGLRKAEDDIMLSVKNYLNLFDVEIDLANVTDEDIQNLEAGFTPSGTEAWEASANKQGGLRKLAKELRIFIGTTSMPASEALLEDQLYGITGVPVFDKETGKLIEGTEDLVVSVDAGTVYNGMLKSAGNSSSQLEVLQKMIMFGKNNPQTGAVVDNIMKKAGILITDYDRILALDSTEPVGAIGTVKDPVFLNAVIKQMTQFTSDYLRIEENTNPELGTGVVSIYAANHADDIAAQLDRWRKRFFTIKTHRWEHQKKAQRSREAASGFADFISAINAGKSLTEQQLEHKAENISKNLRNLTGIDLSTGFIKYSILHELNNSGVQLEPLQEKFLTRNSDSYAMTKKDATILAGLLQNNIDIMSRSKEKFSKETDNRIKQQKTDPLKDGAEGRLRDIAKGNAIFDENVGNTVFTDEKGDLIYSHQLPTYHLTKVAEINKKDIKGLDELRLGDGYLNANYLLNHPAFQQLVKEGKFKIGRVSGKTKVWTTIDPETKTQVATNQSEGIPYSEFGDADFLTSLINLKLAAFDSRNKKLRKKDTLEEDGKVNYALAPVFIRVIADASTGDLTYLPVLQSVKYNDNGQIEFTEEFMDSMEALIENEYNRILQNSESLLGSKENIGTFLQKTIGTGDIKGFNEAVSKQDISDKPEQDRAFKITNNAQLVTAMVAEGMTIQEAINTTASIQAANDINNAVYNIQDPTSNIIKIPGFIIDRSLVHPDGKKRLAETTIERTPRKGSKDKITQTIKANVFTLQEFYDQMFDPTNAAAVSFINNIKQKNDFNDQQVIDYIKDNIYNLEAAYTFVLLHEEYHVNNNHYVDITGEDQLPEELELKANEYALNKIINGELRLSQPNSYVNYSGGAYGVDHFGDQIGREFGVNNHQHFMIGTDRLTAKGLRDKGIRGVQLTEEQTKHAFKELEKIQGKVDPNNIGDQLKARNYYQIKNSDSIYAFGEIGYTKDKFRGFGVPYVKGGTGTAVKMAISMRKPVYIFDINDGTWKKYDYDNVTFVPVGNERITLTPKFAIIGTRNVESYYGQKQGRYLGKQKENMVKGAIRKLYQDTFTPYRTEDVQDTIPEELTQKLNGFLGKYGFDLHHADDLLINLANKDISFDFKDIGQMSKALATPLAVMLSFSGWYHSVKQTLKGTKAFNDKVDAALSAPREEIDPKELFAIENRIAMDLWRDMLESGFQERFKKELNISDSLWTKIKEFLKDLLDFLKQISPEERSALKVQVDQVVDNTFRGGMGGIATTIKDGYTQVNLQQAFDQLEIAKEIQTKIGTNPKIILTGSIAYSAVGTVYRQMDRVVHDLDYVSEMTPEENEKLLMDNFPGSILAYEFGKPSHFTHTYITPPKGYFIDPNSVVRKKPENLKEGEAQLDENRGKIIGYNVIDKKGKVVGTWKLDIAEDNTELGEVATGIKATFVDFFTSNENVHKTGTTEFIGTDGETYKIRVASFESGMEFKLAFSRLKDISDYNRFHKFKNIPVKKEVTKEERFKDRPNILPKGGFKPNTEAKTILENAAVNNESFDQVKKVLEQKGIPLRDVMKSRLNFEFDRFITRLIDLNIIQIQNNGDYVLNGLDPAFMEGFTNDKGQPLNNVNEDFHFEPGELLFNLRQIFFDDYRNTKSINEIFFGDQAQVYKNVIEAIKRAKGSNASGMNVEFGFKWNFSDTLTIRPSYEISAFTHEDVTAPKQYSEGSQEVQDALVTMSLEGFVHWRAGLGNLTPAQAALVDDLMQGRHITVERLLGNGLNTQGMLKRGDAINSKKMVYDDGKSYIKMSVRVLTPDFTTDSNTGEARDGMEKLHNLRLKIENREQELLKRNQKLGLDHFVPVIAVPESASKKFKQNLATAEQAYDEQPIFDRNTITLESRFMKEQQIVPSNKIVIVDPRQIINLLTNEQYDDSVEVFIRGEKYSVGQIKKMFNKDVGLRREFDFTNKRNILLTFNDLNVDNHIYNRLFKDHLDKVEKGEVTIDLDSFKKFALNSLMAGKSKAQLLEFFEGDYNLNNPFTEPKFEELYFSFWKEGFTTKQPGYSLTLVSDVGYKVVKRVIEVDKETGEPTRWEVIPRETWEAMKRNPKKFGLKKAPTLTMKDFADQDTATFGKGNLKEKDYYLDNLRHNVMEYDSEGKPTGQRYTEFAMPPHHASVLKYWKPGMPIGDVLGKGFGIRIPTQDKHSAANMKVVDFMPAYFGSSVIVPREITEISGSDFDIDTQYTHFKEFFVERELVRTSDEVEADWNKYVTTPYVPRNGGPAVIRMNHPNYEIEKSKKQYAAKMRRETGLNYSWNRRTGKFESVYEGKFVEYGTADTIEKEYKEYIRNMIKEANNPGSAVHVAMEKHQSKQGVLLTEQFKTKGLEIYENSTWKEITEYFKEDPFLLNVLKTEMHLPDSLDTYKEYKKFNNNGKVEVGGVVPYKAAYNNRILDYKFALLGNDNITKAKQNAAVANGNPLAVQNQPADLNPLNNPKHIIEVKGVKKLIEETAPAVWQLIQVKAPLLAQQLEEGNLDIDNLYGKSVMKSANAMGTSIVGAAVQPNVVTAIFNSFDIKIKPAKRYDSLITPLELNGITYDDYSTNFLIDPKTGEQDPGRRKAYVISAIITALTDNAKEQLTGKTGLQVSALGVVVNMLALGVDTQTAFGMINHPAIKEVWLQSQGIGVIGVANNLIKDIVLAMKNNEFTKEEIKTRRVQVNSEDLWNDIQKASSQSTYTMDINYLPVLQQFISIQYTKEYTSKVIKLIELLKAPPRNLRSMKLVMQAANELGIDNVDGQIAMKKKQPPFDVRPIFENIDNHLGELWQQTKELNTISPNVFIAASNMFNRIQTLIHNSSTFYGKQGEIDMDRIKNNIISYLMIGAYKGAGILNANGLQTFDNSLIYPQLEGVKITDIVEKIKARLENKGVDGKPRTNYFINFYIDTIKSKDGSEIDKVLTNTFTKISDAEIMRIQVSLLELMNPNDIELSNLAQSLINYLVVKDGMQYRSGSFANAVPAHLFENFIVHLDRIQDVFKKLERINEMTSAERMSLKDELNDIFAEDFDTFALDMVDNMLMHMSSNGHLKRVFDPYEISDQADSPVIFNKPQGETPADLTLDISQGTGLGIQKDESPVSNVPVQILEDTSKIDDNIQTLEENGLATSVIVPIQQKGEVTVRTLAKFPYMIKYTYFIPGRIPGESIQVTKLFKLGKLYSPLNDIDKGSRNNLFNVLDSQQLVGYRAEYYDVTGEQEGSVDQFAGGAIAGKLPLNAVVTEDAGQERSTDKSKNKNVKGSKPQGNYQNVVSYVKADQDGVDVTTVNGNTYNSNEVNLNNAMDQEGEVGRGGSVLDLEKMVGKKEELPSFEEAVELVQEMEDTINEIAMQPDNVAKVLSGEKTTTLRTRNLPSGVYDIGGQLFNLTNRGNLTVEEAGGVEAITKSEAFAETGPKFSSTKKWLEGEGKLYVYDITPVSETINEAETTFAETYDSESGQMEIDFGNEVGASSKKISKTMELWDELSLEEQQQISKHYSIKKFDEQYIKDILGDMLVNKTPKEIIERLKKCS